MKVPVAVLALWMSAPVLAADASTGKAPGLSTAPHCPRTSSYLADQIGMYRGKPPMPKKLTELPPATAYMAVYRRIGGCEAPLTMTEYRNPRR